MKKPEDDLEARKVVWDAMHVLWLDTDVDEIYLPTSAAQCAKTAYTIAELEQIFWHEVYPVMWPNYGALRVNGRHLTLTCCPLKY